MQFAEVILPLNLPRTLTYGIPVHWQGLLSPGMRVEVALGKNKIYSGIVLEIHNFHPGNYTVKPIRNIIDSYPIIQPQQLKFWQWIAYYYLSSLGEVMNAALPAHLKLMSESLLVWSDYMTEPPAGLEDDVYLVAEALHIRKRLTIAEVRQILDNRSTGKVINELLEKKIAIVTEVLEDRFRVKMESYVFLSPPYQDGKKMNDIFTELDKAPKQLNLLMAFFLLNQQNDRVRVTELLKTANCTRGHLNTLVKKGILQIESFASDRLPATAGNEQASFSLTDEQQEVLHQLKAAWQQHNVALLHGITGSGKTHIYIELIKEAISKEQQCLFLLPEIALTTQVVKRLRTYFGDELGVYHSRFSNNERVEIWNKVKEGKYKVVVGARSALWLPFLSLAYVFVDEEHDTSYKQFDPAPRFHARDASIYLASLYNAKVLLGSATPSLESITNARSGKYAYITLNQRYKGVARPEVHLIAANNVQAALSSVITVPLLEQINQTLHQGKQVILFQNKRGYTALLLCSNCGYIVHCNHCDVSLTYHKSTDKMHCHYCGTKSAVQKQCPQCGNNSMSARSFGTEKIEEDLKKIFPKAATSRMDWDSVRGKNSAATIIDHFAKGRIDILVGTQMIVKGLDFHNVGLVGILSADSLLGYPDFRVNERAYQLMEQVSGRAGRADGDGKVFIQAYNMNHPVLQWVKNHDFRTFYHSELQQRQQFAYPPFCRLIKITCRNRNEPKVKEGAKILAGLLHQVQPSIHIQGPAPALVSKVRNYYLEEIWIKLSPDAHTREAIKAQIVSAINKVLQSKGNSSLQFIIDVDPY